MQVVLVAMQEIPVRCTLTGVEVHGIHGLETCHITLTKSGETGRAASENTEMEDSGK